MSSKKQRRLQEQAEMEQKRIASRKGRRLWGAEGVVIVTAAIAAWGMWPSTKKTADKPEMQQTLRQSANSSNSGNPTATPGLIAADSPVKAQESGTAVKADTPKPMTLDALLALKPEQFAGVDIALMNLLCAEGLRGSEDINIQKTLARLDELTARVRSETNRHMYRFAKNPAEFNNSEPYFRIMMLAVVLQEDFGIHYNPARIRPAGVIEPASSFFADSKDVFIHGCGGEFRMGTCSSLPVLYTAVCRRLGYPVKLVTAKSHLFARWEDKNTRMNIEATSAGFLSEGDEHYKKWPHPMSDVEEREFGYLKSLTPAEEFAGFLAARGTCLLYMGKPKEAVATFEQIVRIHTGVKKYQVALAMMRRDAAQLSQPLFIQNPGLHAQPGLR